MNQIPFEIIRVKHPHPSLFNGDKVKAIIKACCDHFDTNEVKLKSKSRFHDVLFARHIAVYLIKQHLTYFTLKGIGQMFNRDHTTAINSIREVRGKLHCCPDDPITIAYKEITKNLPFI